MIQLESLLLALESWHYSVRLVRVLESTCRRIGRMHLRICSESFDPVPPATANYPEQVPIYAVPLYRCEFPAQESARVQLFSRPGSGYRLGVYAAP